MNNKKFPVSTRILEEAFLYSISNLNQFEYVPFFGTLLGIIRDNNFLKNDDDVDFLINIKSKQRLIHQLKDSKIEIDFQAFENSQEYFLQGIYNNNSQQCYVDFYFYEEHDKKNILLKSLHGPYQNDKKNWIIFKKEFIFPLNEKKYKNHKIFIPNKPDKILKFLYGKNWKIKLEKGNYFHYIIFNRPRIIQSKLLSEILKFFKHKNFKKLIFGIYFLIPLKIRKYLKKYLFR